MADAAAAPYQFIVKFVIIGDSGVGKSNLMLRLTDDRYLNSHDVTIGVEFGARIVDVDGTKMKLQIWDTAGQESFRSVTRSYYRGATGALLVFDISRRQTFEHALTWLNDLRQHADPNIAVMLVGNKLDLAAAGERQVSTDEAAAWARDNDVAYMEASAKTGDQVEEAFEGVARQVHAKIVGGVFDLNDKSNGIKIRQAKSGIIPSFEGGGGKTGVGRCC
ncbi:hypothetical protein PYCC9005_003140 [Savitreella phatthalungensis]